VTAVSACTPEGNDDDKIVKALAELIGHEAARRLGKKSGGTTNKNANGARKATVGVGVHNDETIRHKQPPIKSPSD
jgi:hypothetical protein